MVSSCKTCIPTRNIQSLRDWVKTTNVRENDVYIVTYIIINDLPFKDYTGKEYLFVIGLDLNKLYGIMMFI